MMSDYFIRPLKQIFQERSFLVCILFLGISAVGVQVGATWLGLHFVKQPLPLQHALDDLSEERLLPYRVIGKRKIENEDVVAELGTEDYIQWILEDPAVASSDPGRYLVLFITYYTGDPGQVPHVPEVCYQGAGSMITDRENATIHLRGADSSERLLPVRVISEYRKTSTGRQESKVVYFFSANGGYVCSRNALRLRLNHWYDKYAYFSKVEVSFPKGGDMTTDEVVVAVEKLMKNLLPELEQSHWPLWPPPDEPPDELPSPG